MADDRYQLGDQYQLGELLGRGGMGQVHIARHRSGRLVAVKRVRNTLSTDQLLVDRLTDEARLLRSISHPNVVRVLDHGTQDGMPFLVMDRAPGTSLHELIANRGPLPLEELGVIASQLCAGLAAVHDAQIVHVDLKSHNVLVDDVDIVTIIDFGLARWVNDTPTLSGLIAGTPAYMAPEVIAGASPTIASDLYSAAAIVYEMLTGSTPFAGHISTILTRQLTEPVEPPSQRAPNRRISPAIDRVLVRALDPSPAGRYPSVAVFAEAFAAALAGRPEPVIPTSPETSADPFADSWADQWLDQPTALLRRRTVPKDPSERLDTNTIICAALVQAHRLIDERRLPLAIQALEATLAALAPGLDVEAPTCADAWRIQTVLAALYETTGKVERARRMALIAYRHALRSGCPLAQGRAGALVDRLIARSHRTARGSVSGGKPPRSRLGSQTDRDR